MASATLAKHRELAPLYLHYVVSNPFQWAATHAADATTLLIFLEMAEPGSRNSCNNLGTSRGLHSWARH